MPAHRIQRAQAIRAGPGAAGTGAAVPYHRDVRGDPGQCREGGQYAPVVCVAQQWAGPGHRYPPHFGDLVVGLPADVGAHRHRPELDLLLHARFPGEVPDGGQPYLWRTGDAGLLEDLADRGGERVLAVLQFPLGQRPVAVPWPVYQRHLGTRIGCPPGHAARGPDQPGHGNQPVSLCRAALAQASGNFSRASRTAARSLS